MGTLRLKPIGNRRGIEPILPALAILLLALSGSTALLLYSQDDFSDYQGSNGVFELVSVTGYDTRGNESVLIHNLDDVFVENCCEEDLEINNGTKISIFVKNLSEDPVRIHKLTLAGTDYTFVQSENSYKFDGEINIEPGKFVIVTQTIENKTNLVQVGHPAILPGKTGTILLNSDVPILDEKIAIFKITTGSGNQFFTSLETGKLRV